MVREVAVERHLATKMITISTRAIQYPYVRRPLTRKFATFASILVSRRDCHHEEVRAATLEMDPYAVGTWTVTMNIIMISTGRRHRVRREGNVQGPMKMHTPS